MRFFCAAKKRDWAAAPSGAINSLAGADWHVTFGAFASGRLTTWNGADIVWKAILSDSTTDAVDRPIITGRVYNTQLEKVADDSNDLWDGSLDAAIRYDEFANAVSTDEVWSGSNSIGNFSGTSCGDWSNSLTSGTYGNATSAAPNWLQENFQNCSNTARIYGISPPVLVRGILGDYNFNDEVGAADYTVWANTFGQTGFALAADGNEDLSVDAADYTIWANEFGSVAVSPVPEPSAFVLAALGLLSLLAHRWRGRRRA